MKVVVVKCDLFEKQIQILNAKQMNKFSSHWFQAQSLACHIWILLVTEAENKRKIFRPYPGNLHSDIAVVVRHYHRYLMLQVSIHIFIYCIGGGTWLFKKNWHSFKIPFNIYLRDQSSRTLFHVL